MSTPFQPAAEEPQVPVLFPPAPRASDLGLPRETPVFNLLDIFFVLAGAFFILMLVQGVALGVAHALPRFAGLNIQQLAKLPIVLIPAQVVSYIFLIGFIHLLLIARHHVTLTEAIPFQLPRGTTAALLAAGVGLSLAIEFLGRFLPAPKQLPLDDYFKERTAAFIMLAFGVFIAPLVEELFFRGLLYPVVNRLAGAGLAVVLN